jgi:hypothetical protein
VRRDPWRHDFKPVTTQELDWADLVVPVQRCQADHLIEDFPEAAKKITSSMLM